MKIHFQNKQPVIISRVKSSGLKDKLMQPLINLYNIFLKNKSVDFTGLFQNTLIYITISSMSKNHQLDAVQPNMQQLFSFKQYINLRCITLFSSVLCQGVQLKIFEVSKQHCLQTQSFQGCANKTILPKWKGQ